METDSIGIDRADDIGDISGMNANLEVVRAFRISKKYLFAGCSRCFKVASVAVKEHAVLAKADKLRLYTAEDAYTLDDAEHFFFVEDECVWVLAWDDGVVVRVTTFNILAAEVNVARSNANGLSVGLNIYIVTAGKGRDWTEEDIGDKNLGWRARKKELAASMGVFDECMSVGSDKVTLCRINDIYAETVEDYAERVVTRKILCLFNSIDEEGRRKLDVRNITAEFREYRKLIAVEIDERSLTSLYLIVRAKAIVKDERMVIAKSYRNDTIGKRGEIRNHTTKRECYGSVEIATCDSERGRNSKLRLGSGCSEEQFVVTTRKKDVFKDRHRAVLAYTLGRCVECA